MNLKEKLPLIVGIGLPIFLILFVVITAYLPSLFVKPKYNFIFASGNLYDYDLKVVASKVTSTPIYRSNDYRNTPREPDLFVYDSKNKKSTAISLSQAQGYNLDPSSKSPDGFTVGRNESDNYSFFPFFYGGSRRGVYLQGKGLNAKVSDQDYNFKLLGWVIP